MDTLGFLVSTHKSLEKWHYGDPFTMIESLTVDRHSEIQSILEIRKFIFAKVFIMKPHLTLSKLLHRSSLWKKILAPFVFVDLF